MQTILGANGVISKKLAKILPAYTDKIRLVSRNPKKVNSTDEIFQADITDAGKTMKAVEGSEIVYLMAGLEYKIKIWERDWPVIMRNVINACKANNSKLVFFDNVYALGKVNGWMKEDTTMNPSSRKGEVRKKLDTMLLDEIQNRGIKAIIARAPDFYGPDTPTSFVNVMVFEKYKKGKKAQWLVNDKVKHSFIYTPDAAKATAILGNTNSAYNQIWHLPADKNVLTGKEFIELSAKAFGVEPKYSVFPKWMLRIVGIFNPIIKESVEMLYQSDSDYLFDSSKFEETFQFKPTPYSQGIIETADSMK
jgi:nucleoside-diphosphate-sugar epimerase